MDIDKIRMTLVIAGSELSAVGHGRPPSSKEELISMSDACRAAERELKSWHESHGTSRPATSDVVELLTAKADHEDSEGPRATINGRLAWLYREAIRRVQAHDEVMRLCLPGFPESFETSWDVRDLASRVCEVLDRAAPALHRATAAEKTVVINNVITGSDP